MKNFPILICDQIITSAKNVDKFAYFELTLGEYIQVNIFNIINNKVSILDKKEIPLNSHYFIVQDVEFNQWLNNKITFEQLIIVNYLCVSLSALGFIIIFMGIFIG